MTLPEENPTTQETPGRVKSPNTYIEALTDLTLATEAYDKARANLRRGMAEAVGAGATYQLVADITGLSIATARRWVKDESS